MKADAVDAKSRLIHEPCKQSASGVHPEFDCNKFIKNKIKYIKIKYIKYIIYKIWIMALNII